MKKDTWARLEDQMEVNGISVKRAENLKALNGVDAAVRFFDKMARDRRIREQIAKELQPTERERELNREKIEGKLREIQELCTT